MTNPFFFLLGLAASAAASAQSLCGTNTTNGSGQVYVDAVTLVCDATLSDTGGGAIAFQSTVDGSAALAMSTSGLVEFDDAVGAGSALTHLHVNSGSFAAPSAPINVGALDLVTTNGDIASAAAFAVSGNALMDAGSHAISLANTTNAFTGGVALNGRNVNFTNGTATLLDASAVSGSLNLASNGALTQVGPLTVAGTASFAKTSAGAGDIVLNNAGNQLDGDVHFFGTQIDNLVLVNATSNPGALFFHSFASGVFLDYPNASLTLPTFPFTLGSLSVRAGADLAVPNAVVASGWMELQAGGDLAVHGDVTTNGALTLAAAGAATIDSTISAGHVDLTAGADSQSVLSGSIVTTGGSTALLGGNLQLASGAALGDVAVAGSARLGGVGSVGALSNAGTLAPGNAATPYGTLAASAFQQDGGTLEIAAGANPSQVSVLSVSGEADLGGSLLLDLGTSSPNAETTYTVLTAAHVNGAFQTIGVVDDRFAASAYYGVTEVTVRITGFPVGGSVSGLAGSGLVLQLNGGNDIAITANGDFTFPAKLASGESYAATVRTQPESQHCTIARASGTVTGPVADIAVTCTTPQPHLSLSVDDGIDYARYGQVLDYAVTLDNSGDGVASGIAVNGALSEAFDVAHAHWWCFGGGGGAQCGGNGRGALDDADVILPPGRSLTWLVSVPVFAGATAADARHDVAASGVEPLSASDVDTLVLFRDGYESSGETSQPIGAATSFGRDDRLRIVQPDAGQDRRVEDLARIGNDRGALLVQRFSVDGFAYVRLLLRVPGAADVAGEWGVLPEGAELALQAVDAGDGLEGVVLDGVPSPQTMPLPPDMSGALRVEWPSDSGATP